MHRICFYELLGCRSNRSIVWAYVFRQLLCWATATAVASTCCTRLLRNVDTICIKLKLDMYFVILNDSFHWAKEWLRIKMSCKLAREQGTISSYTAHSQLRWWQSSFVRANVRPEIDERSFSNNKRTSISGRGRKHDGYVPRDRSSWYRVSSLRTINTCQPFRCDQNCFLNAS